MRLAIISLSMMYLKHIGYDFSSLEQLWGLPEFIFILFMFVIPAINDIKEILK